MNKKSMKELEANEILDTIKRMKLGDVVMFEGNSGKVCLHKNTGGSVRIFHAECTKEAMADLIASTYPTKIVNSPDEEDPNYEEGF